MIGYNAAKLELPLRMKVHPMFNMVLLKGHHVQRLLPNAILVDDDAEYEIEKILNNCGHPWHF